MSSELQQRQEVAAAELQVLWRVSDVARILALSSKSVHKFVREGKLPCVQVTARERRFAEELIRHE
jgi:predicted site-specific integrase-resolvase